MVLLLLTDVMKADYTDKSSLVYSEQGDIVRKMSKTLTPDAAAEKVLAAQKLLRWVDASVNEKLIFERLLLNLAFSDMLLDRPDE